MKRKVKHLSNISLLAIHLALRAARKGVTRVIVTNDALKGYLGKDKVHEPRIEEFAERLKPIFPRYRLSKEHYGQKNRLVLYLNEKDDPSVKTKPEVVHWIPSQADIDKDFPIRIIECDGVVIKT